MAKETWCCDILAKALANVASKETTPDTITPTLVLDTVAASFKLTKEDLTGRRRDKGTSLARRIAMYLIRQETICSLAQIGRELGNRDAAAVTTACKKVSSEIKNSTYLKRKISEIKRKLQRSVNPQDI